MQISASEVSEAALALADDERGKLVEKLVQSLDGAIDPEANRAWVIEIERRIARIDAGDATMIPMDEAVARLRRAALGR
jgi:putative addiction module component (TIGR02574 family)